ncbi:MAG: SRPBCC domain-containing protein [Deltaproteobacteria bacterium]
MKSTLALVVRRTIQASPARVFDAWTRPEQLRRWWGPRPVMCSAVELDVRVGGVYRIANQFPDGSVLWISGTFEIVEPPRRLVYTWEVERKSCAAPERSRVTVRFEPRDGATEVIVVHERIDSEETRAEHEQGWHGCLENLEVLFGST